MNPIETLWHEIRSLNSIDHLDSPPTPLDFLRNYVSQNKPCLISNAISHWPALSLWPSPSYLSHSLSSTLVSLHLTPHGRADSLTPFPDQTPLPTQKPHFPGKPDNSVATESAPLTTQKPHQSGIPCLSGPTEKAEQFRLTKSTTLDENQDHIVVFEGSEQPGLSKTALKTENPVRNLANRDYPDPVPSPSPAWRKPHQHEKANQCERTKSTLKPGNLDHIVWSGDSEQPQLAENTPPWSGIDGGDPTPLCFASAFVAKVPFNEAISMVLNSGPQGPVAYLQQQNDCFREEYGVLSGDCDGDIEWASEAFGCLPEAVNLWIGNEFSETSWHKDHYENIYAVVSGEKRFLLLPPTDVHRMYVREYPAASYGYDKDTREFKLVLEEPKRNVPWCSVDPYPSPENKARDVARYPLYFNGPKPVEVTVRAGEILYLPSMWFHYVRQGADDQGRTIAINYWYDMQFDIKYAYFKFLSSIPYHIVDDKMLPKLEAGESDSDTFIAQS